MFNGGGLSAGDAIALMGGGRNNDGANGWGDGWWVLIILFAIFGWGGNGFGGNGGATQGALTRGDLCMDMNFNDLQNGVRNVSDQVGLGFANLNSTICNQQYDTARMFSEMNIANLQSFNALQAQQAQCCCDTRAAIAETNYNMAQNTCAITNQIQTSTRDIVEATNAGTRAILDQMCQDKIDTLQNQLNKAELAASQSAQNQYLISQLRPTPDPAFIVPNPFTGSYGFNGYGYGNCGCGC